MKGSLQYKCISAILLNLDWEDTQRLYKDTYDSIMRFFVIHLIKELSKQTQDLDILYWINDIVSVVVEEDIRFNDTTRVFITTEIRFKSNIIVEYIRYSYKIDEYDVIFDNQISIDHGSPNKFEQFFNSFEINNDMLVLYDAYFNTKENYVCKPIYILNSTNK